MKFFSHLAISILVFSFFSVSHLYAQDTVFEEKILEEEENGKEKTEQVMDFSLEESNDKSKDLVESLPIYSDVVKGTVPTSYDEEYYDIYSRTFAFRQSTKDLRASIEARRKAFEKPRIEVINSYRELKEKIYTAEAESVAEEDEYNIDDEDIVLDDESTEDKPVEEASATYEKQ